MSIHLKQEIRVPIDPENPSILRDESKCIRCGACARVCRNDIGVGQFYDLASCQDRPICVNCGQCANVCPADSITERSEWQLVQAAIADPRKIVIVSTSPSVRVALGEEFGMAPGSYEEGRMVAALRALGADYVLDTTFAADLTIMEEAAELVERITNKTKPLPQFTSCCPAWVKFVETFYPEFIPNLSTAKSPIGMQGPTVKTYFAKKHGLDPERIVHVALTPCTAKKFEIRREEFCDAALHNNLAKMPDTDFVITTRELGAWLRAQSVDFAALGRSEYDQLLGRGSGAGIIFGNTGGVMEAALRTAWHFMTGEVPPADLLQLEPVRGMEGVRSAAMMIDGKQIRVAVVHGLANGKEVLRQMQQGNVPFDFLEVMTCRGGCVGGGGQPKDRTGLGDELREARIAGLYRKDEATAVRRSYENPDIVNVYREFYGKPLSELTEQLLHTVYFDRSTDFGPAGMVDVFPAEVPASPAAVRRFKCRICGYVEETGPEGLSAGFQCPVCGVSAENFEELPAAAPASAPQAAEVPATPAAVRRFKCRICGYIEETGPEGLPAGFQCPVCGVGAENFEEL